VKQRQNQTQITVGAGLPAMVFNDDAGDQTKRGGLTFFAGKPAPTRDRVSTMRSESFLILGAPLNTLAERRLESVGNPAGRRVSRAGPRMAHRGGPRIQACDRAHRA